MKYPIAIEPGNATTAWGVVVPDLPGCFSAADSGIDEAITNAQEAIEIWIETALDLGQTIPAPSSITVLQKKPEFKGQGRQATKTTRQKIAINHIRLASQARYYLL